MAESLVDLMAYWKALRMAVLSAAVRVWILVESTAELRVGNLVEQLDNCSVGELVEQKVGWKAVNRAVVKALQLGGVMVDQLVVVFVRKQKGGKERKNTE
jgi:hypothetical protein